MKVILYIGHHKVGSTALQVFLSQNALHLLKHGILYPTVESMGFSYLLSRAVAGSDRAGLLPVHIREPHSALAYQMMAETCGRPVPQQFTALPRVGQMRLALENQVAQLRPHTVILCSEAFSNFGMVHPALVDALCSMFPGAEFQVYCALRRPDQYLVSWHGQRLKVGERLAPLRGRGIKDYARTIHLDYRMVVEPWFRRVPGGNILLRNYGDILRVGGSIADFCAQAEVDFPEGMLPATHANPSLPLSLMEVVRSGNAKLNHDAAAGLRHFLMDVSTDLDLPENRQIEMLGLANRRKIIGDFRGINTYLGRKCGKRGFFADIDQITSLRPLGELEAMALALAQLSAERIDAISELAARTFLREAGACHPTAISGSPEIVS